MPQSPNNATRKIVLNYPILRFIFAFHYIIFVLKMSLICYPHINHQNLQQFPGALQFRPKNSV